VEIYVAAVQALRKKETQTQPPHMTIAQKKDYFSKFLHPASSSELKRVAQMAHMCTLAYNIPAIEVGSLKST
jgi:hypothetical protein